MSKLLKRSKEQREADMNILARLYVKGVSQMEIARQLGISQGQVSNDLKQLLKRWEETRLNDIDRYKHEQLIRINEIEKEMWDSWEKSKVKGKKTINRGKSGEFEDKYDPTTGRKAKTEYDKYWRAGETEEIPVSGDMQYMNGVMWCVQERSKILGLNAPKKIAATDPTGEFEAQISAKDELMGMLSSIVKRMQPESEEEENYVEGVLVNQLESDNSKEVQEDELPALAKRLNEERVKRLPAPVFYDENGASITEAEYLAKEAEKAETKSLIQRYSVDLGE